MKIINWLILIGLLTATTPSFSTVFYSKNEAMELAFGQGAKVEQLSLFPDDSQTAKIQQLAKVKLDSGLFTFYIAKEQDKPVGYAAIETNTVRTKPETLMIVLTPQGELRNVYTLAFHEPPEYMPPEQWFEKLYKRLLPNIDHKEVDGITGATLSTHSSIDSIRKVMAVYEVLVKKSE